MSSLLFAYCVVVLALLTLSRMLFAVLQPVALAWYFIASEVLR